MIVTGVVQGPGVLGDAGKIRKRGKWVPVKIGARFFCREVFLYRKISKMVTFSLSESKRWTILN
jgi:hypothetical protein